MLFRRLLLVCAISAAGVVPVHAQAAEPDHVLRPGEAVRVTYCDGDCGRSTLTARGRLRALTRPRLHLEPGAALRLRLVSDGSRSYPRVLSVRPSQVHVRMPDGPAWVSLRSGWSLGDEGLSIPFDGATRIEARTPRTPGAGALRAAGFGALFGGVGLGGWAYLDHQDSYFPPPPLVVGLLMGGIGAVVGLPVGALVGWFFPGAYWSEVAADRTTARAPGGID